MNDISTSLILQNNGVISRDELIEFLLEHKQVYPNINPLIVVSEEEIVSDEETQFVDVSNETIEYAPLRAVVVQAGKEDYPNVREDYNGESDFIQLVFDTNNNWYNDYKNMASSECMTQINHAKDRVIKYYDEK